MVKQKRHKKGADGLYHINGRKFQLLVGSRAQVWHETAYKTKGDLVRMDLIQNKHGRIVSRKKHNTAKKEKRLAKHGWTAKKGKFGAVKMSGHKKSHKKSKGKKSKGKKSRARTQKRR